MAQHDYVIDNASGATVRADINSALGAIQSLNSGTSAPSSTTAGMLWLDTTGGAPYALKVRDAGNNHWLTLGNVTDPGADGNLELLPGKINLPSSGGVYESDGSTEILTESSGVVSLKNTTLNVNNIFPSGHVLQTISDNFETETSVTDNSYVIINSNFKVDITPSSTSNKILVMYTIPGFSDRTNATYSTTIFRSISGGTSNTNIGSATHGFGVTVSNAGSVASGQSAVFLDSPNTTSAVTYQPVHKETSTGIGYACINSSKATLTCMEIKQ